MPPFTGLTPRDGCSTGSVNLRFAFSSWYFLICLEILHFGSAVPQNFPPRGTPVHPYNLTNEFGILFVQYGERYNKIVRITNYFLRIQYKQICVYVRSPGIFPLSYEHVSSPGGFNVPK